MYRVQIPTVLVTKVVIHVYGCILLMCLNSAINVRQKIPSRSFSYFNDVATTVTEIQYPGLYYRKYIPVLETGTDGPWVCLEYFGDKYEIKGYQGKYSSCGVTEIVF